MTMTTDRSIQPAVGHGTWGHCGMCAEPANRWAAGSTPTVHMWVCSEHADSYITTDAS